MTPFCLNTYLPYDIYGMPFYELYHTLCLSQNESFINFKKRHCRFRNVSSLYHSFLFCF